MDPLQMMQLLMAQGSTPQLPRTPIPAAGLPSIEQPAQEPAGPELSEFEKMMASLKAGQEKPAQRGPSGGAATLNPFYNPSSQGMGTDTITKMASAMGGK